jgi:hypothetical protein
MRNPRQVIFVALIILVAALSLGASRAPAQEATPDPDDFIPCCSVGCDLPPGDCPPCNPRC